MQLLTFITIIVLIFVNGFTDAPNAITTVVSTGVLKFKKAAFLSALFNFLGIFVMSIICFKVANGISNIVVLESGEKGLIVLISAILSCSIFSIVSSFFGIPTSETHGLISGLIGSIAVIGNLSNVNIYECLDIIYGLIWSIIRKYFNSKNYIYIIE